MFQIFKELRAQKAQATQEQIAQYNEPLENRKYSASLDENIAAVKQLFCDVDFMRDKTIGGNEGNPLRCFLVFFDGVVNSEIINDNVVRPLMAMRVGEAKKIDAFSQLVQSVTYGDTVLFVENSNEAATPNTKLRSNANNPDHTT